MDDDDDDDDDDDTDDDSDHKNDSYTAAGAAPGASVPYFLFLVLWTRPFGPGSLVLARATELQRATQLPFSWMIRVRLQISVYNPPKITYHYPYCGRSLDFFEERSLPLAPRVL